jgi:hypothetical protein
VSSRVRFVLRERGLIREKKLKGVERSMKNGKRTSVNKRGIFLVLKGICGYLLGEPVDVCAQRLFTVSLFQIVFLWLW